MGFHAPIHVTRTNHSNTERFGCRHIDIYYDKLKLYNANKLINYDLFK